MTPGITVRAATGLLGALLALGSSLAWGQAVHSSDEVKAAFLYNFTKYIEWPDDRAHGAPGPLVIATDCAPAFNAVLQKLVRGRSVRQRPIEVREVRYSEQVSLVHVLYVCAEEERLARPLIEATRGKPVVTVGETADFAEQGGIIVLVLEGERVRFDINAAAARRADLRLSAQLQKLARRVHGADAGAMP